MRRSAIVGIALSTILTMLQSPAGAEDSAISFQTILVSTSRPGLEPVISYAPNGTVWIGGTINPGAPNPNGSLWYAVNDTSSFNLDEDPPTSGGADATPHHDLLGRLFWSEFNATSGFPAAVRVNGVWTVTTLDTGGDRPWFRTDSSGFTYIVYANTTASQLPVADIRRYDPSTATWSKPFSFKDNIRMHDFINDTADTFYVTLRNASNLAEVNISVGTQSASLYNTTWSFTPEFTAGTDIARLVRPAVDLAGNLYVVSADKSLNVTSLNLRHFDGTFWSVHKLCTGNVTCAFPAAVAGRAGRIGVAWYETDGVSYPESVGASAVWRFQYGLFDNATGVPSLRQKVLVADRVHVGNLTIGHVGDFTSLSLRRGDALGRVSIAFTCDAANEIGCPTSPPVAVFAVQTTGEGLYG